MVLNRLTFLPLVKKCPQYGKKRDTAEEIVEKREAETVLIQEIRKAVDAVGAVSKRVAVEKPAAKSTVLPFAQPTPDFSL
ncbi:hypothetical protein PRIPAC_90676 [Pristionchus pacificus]|uniref:Uncharacterized protein n=1 Tax=Pristionchus pacificus TaxID=54126 RepID=A0A2A6CWC0_PRIPA|nr:hypothetical protein PRIPAC_90676 [Pristionchus pacificus]|eukprot:PDM82522.1 hypothetical protein PRIPAC_36915 [Pristionchus pacificus]